MEYKTEEKLKFFQFLLI